jgi:predicted RecA/RadA family phage recombinase
MTNRFVQSGEVLDHTPAGAVANGQMVVIGARVGIALAAIAAGATGALAVTGVFTYNKLSTDTMAQGALVYFDAANNRLTTTVGSNVLAGIAAAPAAATTTTVQVSLNA